MKLRNKITLVFVLLTSLLQLFVSLLIYHFAQKYTESEFYLRLRQRATIAAQTYLAEDEMDIDIYEKVRTIHLQTLPDEKEMFYPVAAHDWKNDAHLPESFFLRALKHQSAEIKIDDFYYTGLFYHDNEGDFIVVLAARDLYGNGKLDNLRDTLLASFLFSFALTWILGRYVAKQALSPISRIIKKVNTIEATNLHSRLEVSGKNDELSQLAKTFNSMLDRLEASFELQTNFVNNASHELRNPLTAILGQVEVALNKERSGKEYQEILQGIEAEAGRLDLLVNGLLRLAQADAGNQGLMVVPIRLDEVILDIKRNMDETNPRNKVHLDFDTLPVEESLLVVMGSQRLLEVALYNILDNACKFSENKRVSLRIVASTEEVKVVITDEGIGIPEHELKNIYEPFFRGSNARGIDGFGFGLPLAYRIIKMHHGELRVTSQEGKGTMVKISFPKKALPKPSR